MTHSSSPERIRVCTPQPQETKWLIHPLPEDKMAVTVQSFACMFSGKDTHTLNSETHWRLHFDVSLLKTVNGAQFHQLSNYMSIQFLCLEESLSTKYPQPFLSMPCITFIHKGKKFFHISVLLLRSVLLSEMPSSPNFLQQ